MSYHRLKTIETLIHRWHTMSASALRSEADPAKVMGELDAGFRAVIGHIQKVPPNDTPTVIGHYWAKWKIPDEGSSTGNEVFTNAHWEVVEVVDSGDNSLLASVSGEAKSQGLENFFWGPGPLVAPT